MKSLLNALQDGRLVELPVKEKDKALEYLALLIEAIPDIGSGQDIVKEVKERESEASTGIGMGVACPHIRSERDGELLCAVGWSPEGIDYGSPDGRKVHLVIMYYIPNSQRNAYLKEVSGLAKAIKETAAFEMLSSSDGIQAIRSRLLDWIESSFDKAIPDSKARMIKIEERQSKSEESRSGQRKFSIVPFSLLVTEPGRFLLLSNDESLVANLEGKNELLPLASQEGLHEIDIAGCHVSVLSSSPFCRGRQLLQCVAIKT